MGKVSVLIPSRNSPFAAKTVEEILTKAVGDIEVVITLDGYWPIPPIPDDPRVIIIHRGASHGMRAGINTGARIASGDYLMKLDDHCMLGEGFDEILQADCEKDWLAVPSRYSLDAEKWERTRGPVDYLYLTFPYNVDDLYGTGLHGKKWKGEKGLTGSFWYKEQERKHILIDEILTFQGSCWFMHKKRFFEIGMMDEQAYNHHQEAQELGFKVWLSGGKVVRNKKTWYAHMHKGKTHGRGFRLSKQRMVESEMYSMDLWMNNKWSGQTRPLKWLIDRFWPLEGWPEDWDNPKYQKEFVHPRQDLLNGCGSTDSNEI